MTLPNTLGTSQDITKSTGRSRKRDRPHRWTCVCSRARPVRKKRRKVVLTVTAREAAVQTRVSPGGVTYIPGSAHTWECWLMRLSLFYIKKFYSILSFFYAKHKVLEKPTKFESGDRDPGGKSAGSPHTRATKGACLLTDRHGNETLTLT
jgi:hypothetical protein